MLQAKLVDHYQLVFLSHWRYAQAYPKRLEFLKPDSFTNKSWNIQGGKAQTSIIGISMPMQTSPVNCMVVCLLSMPAVPSNTWKSKQLQCFNFQATYTLHRREQVFSHSLALQLFPHQPREFVLSVLCHQKVSDWQFLDILAPLKTKNSYQNSNGAGIQIPP